MEMKIIAIVMVLIVLFIIVTAIMMVIQNNRVPSELGINDGKLADMPSSPNAVSSQSADPEKRVSPIPFSGNREESIMKIKEALSLYGRIEIKDETEDYIHAVSTTEKMKYHDDLEFYFDDNAKIIQFRSASRVGYSDMGLNRERYNHLITLYSQQD